MRIRFALLVSILLACASCGPNANVFNPNPGASPATTPTSAPATLTSIVAYPELCDALRGWNPETDPSIVSSSLTYVYVFTAESSTISALDDSGTQVLTNGDYSLDTCVVQFQNGVFQGVLPNCSTEIQFACAEVGDEKETKP